MYVYRNSLHTFLFTSVYLYTYVVHKNIEYKFIYLSSSEKLNEFLLRSWHLLQQIARKSI